MKFSVFTIISLIVTVSTWLMRSMEDGKITLQEVLELLAIIAQTTGLPLEKEIISLKDKN